MKLLRRVNQILQPTALSNVVNYANPLSVGLVGAWPTAGGTKLIDVVGGRHLDLTFPNVSGGTYITGSELGHQPRFYFGNAGVFAKYLNTTDAGLLLGGATNITLSMWVKLPTLTQSNAGLIGAWDGSGYMLYKNTTDVRFYIGSNFITTSTNFFPSTDTFHHVAATWNSATSTGKIYLNGKLVVSTTLVGSSVTAINPATGNFMVAGYNNTAGLNGQVGIPAIWKRTLSDSEILDLYLNPFGMFGPDVIEVKGTRKKVRAYNEPNYDTIPNTGELDWGNPILKAVDLIWTPAGLSYSCSGVSSTLQRRYSTKSGYNGLPIVSAGYDTVFGVVPSLYSTNYTHFGVAVAGTAGSMILISSRDRGNMNIITTSGANMGTWGVADVNFSANGTIAPGTIFPFIIMRNGSQRKLWLGPYTGTTSSADSPTGYGGIAAAVGAQSGDSGSQGGTPIANGWGLALLVSLSRSITDEEARLILQNPWAVFKTKQLRAFGSALAALPPPPSGILSAAPSAQFSGSSGVAVTQNHFLVGANSTNAQSIPGVAVTQNHLLVKTDASSSATSSALAITQNYVLSALSATSSNTSGTGTVTQNQFLVASTATSLNTSSALAVLQNQLLVSANASSSAASGTGTVTQNQFLVTSNSNQGNLSSNVSLNAGNNILAGSPSSQGNTSTTGSLVQNQFLLGSTSTENSTSSSSFVTQQHALLTNTAQQVASVTGVAVTQNQFLVGVNSTTLNLSGTGIVYQNQILVSTNIQQTATSPSYGISQNHNLASPVVTQLANVTNVNISASYTLQGSNSTQINTSNIYIQYIVYGQFVQYTQLDFFTRLDYSDIFAQTINSDVFAQTVKVDNFV